MFLLIYCDLPNLYLALSILHGKCISLNNEQCMAQPILINIINIHSNEYIKGYFTIHFQLI